MKRESGRAKEIDIFIRWRRELGFGFCVLQEACDRTVGVITDGADGVEVKGRVRVEI